MTSEKKIKSNRENARRSTGPRSSEGKEKSSRNAITHGLTAEKTLVLPNEDPAEFLARAARWEHYYARDNADPAHHALVRRAAIADWKLDRCARHEAAVLARRVRGAGDDFDRDEHARVEGLGRRLDFDPVNRDRDPFWKEAPEFAAWRDDDPAVLVRALEATAAGVDWLLARWARLAESLDADCWVPTEIYLAVRLLGRRPFDILEDWRVGEIFQACRSIDPEADQTDFEEEVKQARMGSPGKPTYRMRMRLLDRTRPGHDAALASLRAVVSAEVRRLEALKGGLRRRGAADRAEAGERAMFDASRDGESLRRYEAALSRELHRSIAEASKLREESASRPRPPEGAEPAPAPAPAPAPEALGGVAASPNGPVLRNEPTGEGHPEARACREGRPRARKSAPPPPG